MAGERFEVTEAEEALGGGGGGGLWVDPAGLGGPFTFWDAGFGEFGGEFGVGVTGAEGAVEGDGGDEEGEDTDEREQEFGAIGFPGFGEELGGLRHKFRCRYRRLRA